MKHFFILVFSCLFFIWLFLTNILLFTSDLVFSTAYLALMYPEKVSLAQSQKASNIVHRVHSDEQFSQLSVAENRHMNDVQFLFRTSLKLWVFVFIGLFSFYLFITHFFVNVSGQTILKPVINTIIPVFGFVGLLALFLWNSSFILFHQLLFKPGTWSFPLDSTLIQLFPETFWQHIFIVLLIMPVIEVFTLKQCTQCRHRTHNFRSNGTIPQ